MPNHIGSFNFGPCLENIEAINMQKTGGTADLIPEFHLDAADPGGSWDMAIELNSEDEKDTASTQNLLIPVIFIIIAYDYKPMLIVVSLLQIAMSPVMSTLILTVEVFDGVHPTWCKWSKGLATYAMINEFYDHYTGHVVEPDQPQKPAEPVKLEPPQPTTRLKGEATVIVPVPLSGRRLQLPLKSLNQVCSAVFTMD
ncbi:hypothetical protein PQX77_017079 [Marasmius sp. AFHP31]|nr:hypothetical protein PQX77_017079 [Marasmius sp. AFHP31]